MYRNSVRFSLYWMALSVLVSVLLIRRSLHDEMIPQRHLVPSLSSVDLSLLIVPTEDDESFVDTTKNDSKMEVAPTKLQPSSSQSSIDFHHLSTRTTNQSSTFTAQQRIMAAAHFSLAQSRQQQQQQHLIPTPRNSSQSVFFSTIYNFNNRSWVLPKQCESRCHSTVDPSGPYLLSHSAYGELADIDTNHWKPAQALLDFTQKQFWNECFPPIVIIYLYTMRDVNHLWRQMTMFPGNLKRPYIILATGWVIDYSLPFMQRLLQDPNLIRIYASSVELNRQDPYQVEKLYTLPLGLIRNPELDQGTALVNVMTSLRRNVSSLVSAATTTPETYGESPRVLQPQEAGPQRNTKLLLVNFSPYNFKAQFRTEPFQHCCNSTETVRLNTTCTEGGFYDYVPNPRGGVRRKYTPTEWQQASRFVYRDWAQHKYTVAPRGQKMDCYRFWESLYVGSVPIVWRGHQYYRDLLDRYFHLSEHEVPILYVDHWHNITKDYLEQEWPRFAQILAQPEWQTWPPKYLTMDYVEEEIRQAVQHVMETRGETLSPEGTQYYNPDDRDWFWKDRHRCHE